jgi:hypothetical protein
VLLLVLAHVDADHVLVGVEELLAQRFGQFGLSHASWAQEEETAERLVSAREART